RAPPAPLSASESRFPTPEWHIGTCCRQDSLQVSRSLVGGCGGRPERDLSDLCHPMRRRNSYRTEPGARGVPGDPTIEASTERIVCTEGVSVPSARHATKPSGR